MAASEMSPSPRWGRIVAVLLAAFLLTEAASQAFFVHLAGKPYNSIFLYNWSPYGLVRNNPDLTGNFSISPDGFREVRTYSQEKPANTLRLFLMGGSVLYAGSTPKNSLPGYVPSDQTISQYLAALLKADPAFAGVNVEVINAGVNYNLIREVSGAYLADYIHWSPDMLVVYGSANNFPYALRAGEVDARLGALQGPHVWRAEFDRLVNERSASATGEGVFRQAADASAALAIFHKVLTRLLVETDPLARFSLKARHAPAAEETATPQLATEEEEQRYFDLYSSYAQALIGATSRLDQDIAFVWEYHLGDLGGIKSMSAEEMTIFPHVERPPFEREYDFRTRDRWATYLREQGVTAVDPLEEIKASPQTVFNDYLHYTAGGNEVVARATYKQLREQLIERVAQIKAREAARGS